MRKVFLILILFVAIGATAQTKSPVYYDAKQFLVIGKIPGETKVFYNRLPDSLEKKCRQPVWDLGRNTAGMAIRFSSNSTNISAKWTSWLDREMNHMTPTGIRGLDLYALQDDSTWTFVNSGRPKINTKFTETNIIADMEPKMREYMLYLPLYDGIDSLYIGVDSLSQISGPKVNLPVRNKPIVFYGTSILQGGCASRPGMAHTNILERMLNRETYNFGFSGNAQLDYEIAELISQIDAGIFVLDFVPNVTVAQIDEKMMTFYKIIRDKHPNTPILIIESPLFPHMRFNKDVYEKVTAKNLDLKAHFEKIKKQGDNKVYYLPATNILGSDNEATVDGNHFTDLGFLRFANVLLPLINNLSKK